MSQYLQTTCHGTNNSVHSKGLKFAIAFCWLADNFSCYIFSKNANSWKTHCVKATTS